MVDVGDGDGVKKGVKKILMFSDIEGCQQKPGDEKSKQSKVLCSNSFYTNLDDMLDPEKGGDPNLHVAFLGDYFDQGVGVYVSIKGMERLHKRHKGRVHIILGNRDVNKLRFIFELQKKPKSIDNGWNAWTDFFDTLQVNSTNDINLVKHILWHSMGAKLDVNGVQIKLDQIQSETSKMAGLYSFVHPMKRETADDKMALIYLKSAFGIPLNEGETKPEDFLDVLSFLRICKIAHVFEDKLLLAHGGGFDPDAFFGEDYVKSFNPGVDFVLDSSNYHTTLEKFRKELAGMNPKPDGESTVQVSVQKSVDVYNQLFQEVLDEIGKINVDRTIPYTWKFVLLQALGLKPDIPTRDNPTEDARYKSLIQSCSQDGCKGPNNNLSNDLDVNKLEKVLSSSNIIGISTGHKPTCFPIPIIYQRSKPKDVTFISNDTSNANRSIYEIGNTTAIGTIATINEDGSLVSEVKVITLDDTKSPAFKYEAMFGPFSFSSGNPPPLYKTDGNNYVLEYVGKKLIFGPGYEQRKFEDIPESNIVSPGGRRRSRNRKYNTKKRGSKRLSKRTKRNKHHTKRSRKQRKH
jgi:hypothetical protein